GATNSAAFMRIHLLSTCNLRFIDAMGETRDELLISRWRSLVEFSLSVFIRVPPWLQKSANSCHLILGAPGSDFGFRTSDLSLTATGTVAERNQMRCCPKSPGSILAWQPQQVRRHR